MVVASGSSGLWGRFGLAWVLLVVLVLGAGLLVACDSGAPVPAVTATAVVTSILPEEGIEGAVTTTPVPSPEGLDAADISGVYVAVISAMLDKEGKAVQHVYISPYIGQGEHLDNPDADTPIPEKLLAALKSVDRSESRVYEARGFEEAVTLDQVGKVKDDGVLITLGPIVNERGQADAVSVRASIYREAKSAEGNIYSLERDTDATTGWKIMTAAPEWDSEQ